MQATLENLREAVIAGSRKQTVELTTQLLSAGYKAPNILTDGLIAGMNIVGERFKCGEFFVPEMLVASRAMQSALDILKPTMVDADIKPLGTVVIGTVRGDLHDIGKNLTAMFLEGTGFRVIDLGVDVPADKFVDAVKEHQPDLVGMSALLTTTMGYAGEVIKALEATGLRSKVKVIVGGAPVTAEWATRIGADAYAPDAASGAERCKELLM
jgi:5-methyltetrahydrofolate--homocysteine methyltransferase